MTRTLLREPVTYLILCAVMCTIGGVSYQTPAGGTLLLMLWVLYAIVQVFRNAYINDPNPSRPGANADYSGLILCHILPALGGWATGIILMP